MICEYCRKDPGNKPNGVWKGFQDADTTQHVCWGCKAVHYRIKFKDPSMRGLYSEMPVIGVPVQLSLQLR